ncbi:unnamed protein product [Rotaria sp. Silwood1]|nr:unnamed protein product [Rotaria sp. Silwood1]
MGTQTTTTTTTTTTATTTTTTTATTTTTTTTMQLRNVMIFTPDNKQSDWKSYNYTFTAKNTSHYVMFGFQGTNNRAYYLDSVSVVAQNASSTELLRNPSFESSATTPIDWVILCPGSCNCYKDTCNSGIDFIAQTFSTSIGNIYTLSFWLNSNGGGSGGSGANNFYVDII